MIKEALQYIVDLRKPEVLKIDGETYTDKDVKRVCHNPKAVCLSLTTLTSLVDYIRAGIDVMSDKMIIQVVDPLQVRLISMLDNDRIREELVRVEGKVPRFLYGQYIDREAFNIALQAMFLPEEGRNQILRFVGTVQNNSVMEYGDDGVSQKATIRKGIAGLKDEIVPNPVKLRPFRTFLEVEQPESAFVFRMKEDKDGDVKCAIFEADGGAWKNRAMESVKGYLQDKLKDFPQFTVIS